MSAHVFLLKVLGHLFLPAWMALTVGAAFFTARLIGPGGGQFKTAAVKAPGLPLSTGSWLAVGLFCLFVAGYVALIFAWEDFAYYDNSQFTLFSLRGENFPPPIWIDSGRFFPLAFQEFNLVGRISHSVVAYHAVSVIQLLIICGILLTLDRDLSAGARAALATCALLSPGLVISFGGLIYPERNVIFWLVCLLFFVRRFDQTQSVTAAVGAIVSAQFLLYYKEAAFVLVWGFVGGRLLWRCWNVDGPCWDFRRFRDGPSRLDFCLAALGVVFLVCYALIMFHHTRLQYMQDKHIAKLDLVLSYMEMDLLAWLFAAVVAVRALCIWKRRITPSPFWEGLAYGGVGYFVAFLCLGMFSAYYLAPVDLIAVLYLGRLIVLSWHRQSVVGRTAIAAVSIVVLTQCVSLSAVREFERKNLIHAKSEIAGVIQAQYQQRNGASLRLFFPFARPYETMEFAAYLRYRGLPVEGLDAGAKNKSPVLIVCRALPSDGRLQGFREIKGHAGQTPEAGDLVIVLPDDDISNAEAAPYLIGGNGLFLCEPCARFPQWLWAFVKPLHFVSPRFERDGIPNHWLDASVTVWKGPANSALSRTSS